MSWQRHWAYNLNLSDTILDEMIKELDRPELGQMSSALIQQGESKSTLSSARSTQCKLIKGHHWIGAFFMHYVSLANHEAFHMQLGHYYDHNLFQYANYHEGDYYTWHHDEVRGIIDSQTGEPCEEVRKLSYSFLLNDDYEGGEMLLAYTKADTGDRRLDTPEYDIQPVPNKRGTLIVFDSRTMHCVRPVTKGIRRSIVGWVTGPPVQ